MAFALPDTAPTAPEFVRTGKVSQAMPAVLAMLFGMLIVGVAGFSHIDAVHNAAHDTRHANGFPCH